LSEIFTAHSRRWPYERPIEKRETMSGCAAATAAISADIAA
jgi:hypothetical protein